MANNTESGTKKKPGVSSFLRGTILTDDRVTRQFPFLIFLVVLGLLMITNRYRSEKVIRQIEILQGTIDDLRSQSVTNSARLMHMSKPSDVANRVRNAGLGLEEPIRPPRTIEVRKIKERK
ncbi:MAG: FtsL-like putative cell division protein [Bacteroidota bacterium]